MTSGALAEQLRSGLQNRVDGCNSRTCLQVEIDFGFIINNLREDGGMVYTRDLKSLGHYDLAGSSPAPRTKIKITFFVKVILILVTKLRNSNPQGRKPDDPYGTPTEAGEKIQWIFAR